MALIVQKFGGTSVGDPEKIRRVARRVGETVKAGNQVCVVVSAMGDSTDRLVDLAAAISDNPHPREMDMLLTSGERISMALLCMAIRDLGLTATSLTGSQAGIVTDSTHSKAKIVAVRGDRVRAELENGHVAVVAGFQGFSQETRDITTLGRGGSDVTAVALAAALGAASCEIYTDVRGVYTADPRLVPAARLLPEVSYEEMLEMAATGARVLMLRSVEFARNHNVPLHVRSTFTAEVGTLVHDQSEEAMEQPIISGVTHDTSEAKVTLSQVPDRPGIAAAIFRSLADAEVNVDMIVQNVSTADHTDVSFTVPRDDLKQAITVMEDHLREFGAQAVTADERIGKVSLVGAGMKTHPGVAAKMFEVLRDIHVNIEMISTSPIRISCVINEDRVPDAVAALHDAFDLSEGV